ncbi:hypothetical protein GASC598I20_006300, partial [Gilliamella apicola SCGC AB-598-I20]
MKLKFAGMVIFWESDINIKFITSF